MAASPSEVIVYMNKLDIKFERKFNEHTFLLDNKNYDNENIIMLCITKEGFTIILCGETILRKEEFTILENLYEKYNFFKTINKYYNNEKFKPVPSNKS